MFKWFWTQFSLGAPEFCQDFITFRELFSSIYSLMINIACVASVSIWFRSKERPVLAAREMKWEPKNERAGRARKELQTNPSILKTCVRQRTKRLIGSASQKILPCVDLLMREELFSPFFTFLRALFFRCDVSVYKNIRIRASTRKLVIKEKMFWRVTLSSALKCFSAKDVCTID